MDVLHHRIKVSGVGTAAASNDCEAVLLLKGSNLTSELFDISIVKFSALIKFRMTLLRCVDSNLINASKCSWIQLSKGWLEVGWMAAVD